MINADEVQVGDFVRLKSNFDRKIADEGCKAGDVIEVIGPQMSYTYVFGPVGVELEYVKYYPGEFELVEDDAPPQPVDLGVYRPELETRKVGKVQIDLVDTGFPLATWELAKLMTWAADAKGYKRNDWKNLEGWEEKFPAAASRHRIMPLLGQKFDPESGLHHKVHELFNVFAELELELKACGMQLG